MSQQSQERVVTEQAVPTWCVVVFATMVIVAAGYWLAYERFAVAGTPMEIYTQERLAALEVSAEVTEATLLELQADSLAMASAGKLYSQNCARCHGDRAQGQVGPNLTDSYWLYGGKPVDIYASIRDGRSAKGMPAWGRLLGPGKCKQLTAYLLNYRDSNVPGKAPEGDVWPAK